MAAARGPTAGSPRPDPASGARWLRAAAWCAYAAGAGGIAGVLALLGFFAWELESPDQPLGTASDLATASVGLLIPAALALSAYLPSRRRTWLVQGIGIAAMAVTAAAGPLMVAGQLSYDIETPVSAASSLVVVGWAAVASRMLRPSGPFRSRVTRLGQAIGVALLAGAALVGAGLALSGRSLTSGSLAGMSLPHQVILWSGVAIGGTAWCLSTVWDLLLGRELARAAQTARAGSADPAGRGARAGRAVGAGPADPATRAAPARHAWSAGDIPRRARTGDDLAGRARPDDLTHS